MANWIVSSWTAAVALSALLCASCATAAAPPAAARPDPEAVRSLAPQGRLRVAINLGNSVLAMKDPATGELGGVSVALAREIGRRLGVPVEMTPYDAAGKVFAALETGSWDLAFLAVEPERAEKIDFSPPYVVIDGTYLVRNDSPIRSVADADKPGVKITVARGAAYDLFLSRNLKNAELVRSGTGAEAIAQFKRDRLDASAGIRQALQAAAEPGYRVVGDSYSRIEQAMAVPKGREAGARYVRQFIEEMKASGFVRKALDESGQTGAGVAPPAPAR